MSESAYAASPFDHAKADVIIRSADNIDFRVFKLFLSLAFPFFDTLFDIPQPIEESEEQEIKDGLAVIPVSEDSKTSRTSSRQPKSTLSTPSRGKLAEPSQIPKYSRLSLFGVLPSRSVDSCGMRPCWLPSIR
jgi:hypothetical protein